jgi:hypothetical protein
MTCGPAGQKGEAADDCEQRQHVAKGDRTSAAFRGGLSADILPHHPGILVFKDVARSMRAVVKAY